MGNLLPGRLFLWEVIFDIWVLVKVFRIKNLYAANSINEGEVLGGI